MKIAFLADCLDKQYAGIYIYTKELIRAVSSVDSEHSWYLVRSKPKSEFQNTKEIVVPIHSVPGHQSLRLFVTIPRKLAKEGIDLVIEPGHFGPFNLPKHILRMTIMHDLTTLLFPKLHVFHSQLLQRIFLPGILKRADSIVTNSFHTTRDLHQVFPFTQQKTTPVYPGADTIFIPTEDQSVLHKYQIQNPYFLYVGTLEPRKSLHTLLDAYTRFRKQGGKEYALVLVGKKGWKTETFFEKLDNHPYKSDIILTGYVDREELPVLFTMAESFIYPSLYEGFGLPVLEAMKCGSACILSETSSLPEVGGNAALYFPPENSETLSQLMLQVSNSPEQRVKMKSGSLIQAANFSWEKAATQFLKVIDQLAKGR